MYDVERSLASNSLVGLYEVSRRVPGQAQARVRGSRSLCELAKRWGGHCTRWLRGKSLGGRVVAGCY